VFIAVNQEFQLSILIFLVLGIGLAALKQKPKTKDRLPV